MLRPRKKYTVYDLQKLKGKRCLTHIHVKSPEEAQRQICAAAFWMAQWEKANGNSANAKELLKIAVDTGNPDLTEWQLANWQWNKK